MSTTEAPPPAPAYNFTHRQIQTIFGGLMAGMFLAALDQTIVATALPTIVGEFGGLDHISWVASAYLLTTTAIMPLAGKLSDLYGRRVLFQASILVFLLGSLLAGASQSMGQLIAFRAVQGLGAGGLLVTYCTGPACNAATKGAAALASLGFRVKEMLGGIEAWEREGYPIER